MCTSDSILHHAGCVFHRLVSGCVLQVCNRSIYLYMPIPIPISISIYLSLYISIYTHIC